MSLLIKGMEMVFGGQTIEIAENVDGRKYARIQPSFDEWHEVIGVPTPHGRLIDVDDANCYAYDILETCHDMNPWEAAREMQKIFFRDAPTVIEAEE